MSATTHPTERTDTMERGPIDPQVFRNDRHLHVQIPQPLDDALRRCAKDLGCTTSTAARMALAHGIEALREGQDQGVEPAAQP